MYYFSYGMSDVPLEQHQITAVEHMINLSCKETTVVIYTYN